MTSAKQTQAVAILRGYKRKYTSTTSGERSHSATEVPAYFSSVAKDIAAILGITYETDQKTWTSMLETEDKAMALLAAGDQARNV